MKYVAGADHAGVLLKDDLVRYLEQLGVEVEDLGTNGSASVDYPDFARRVAEAIRSGRAQRGLLICGTGIGISIAANKVPGIRAAAVSDPFSARMAVEHNDAQILCMGARVVGSGLARMIFDAFHSATFEGGRHQRRIEGIHALERLPPERT